MIPKIRAIAQLVFVPWAIKLGKTQKLHLAVSGRK